MYVVKYRPGYDSSDSDEYTEILGYFDGELDAQAVVASQNILLKFNNDKTGRYYYEELVVDRAEDYVLPSTGKFIVYVHALLCRATGEVYTLHTYTSVNNEDRYPRTGRVVAGNPFYSVFFSDWNVNFTDDIEDYCIKVAKKLVQQYLLANVERK